MKLPPLDKLFHLWLKLAVILMTIAALGLLGVYGLVYPFGLSITWLNLFGPMVMGSLGLLFGSFIVLMWFVVFDKGLI